MQKRRLTFNLLYLAFIISLVAFNQWLFGALWEISYFDWYINNGSQIALITAFAALVWDVNQVTGLVSAEPLRYVSGYFHLVGMTFYSLGRQSGGNRKERARPAFADLLITSIISLLLILLILTWFVLVTPIQYFFIAIIGAPARIVLESQIKLYAKFADGKLIYQEIPKEDLNTEKSLKNDGWFNVSISGKAVAFTNVLLALTLFAIKYFLA